MAGSVLNWTFGFLINISAKLKVSASKSATSPSCQTLGATAKQKLNNQERDTFSHVDYHNLGQYDKQKY